MSDKIAAPHLFDRICWGSENLPRVETDLVVVYHDDPEGPAKILAPAPEWMAMALAGGLLPPVDVYHRLEISGSDEVLNGHIIHEAEPLGPLTEEQAVEYLVMKDVPRHVWDAPAGSNSSRFAICRKDQIPTDRTFRNAWVMA